MMRTLDAIGSRCPCPRSAGARGFALPLVLVVMLVGSATVAVMLTRQSAQSLAVRRHIDHYQEHHGAKGLAEVVNAWLLSLPADPSLAELVEDDSSVLDLILADGSVATISLTDGQSRVLRRFGQVDANGAVDGPGILAQLRALVPASELTALTRDAGPAAISVHSAPRTVLLAAMRYVAVGEPEDPDQQSASQIGQASDEQQDLAVELVEEILRARDEDDRLSDASLAAIASRVGLSGDQRRLFNRVLASTPTHFELEVDLRSPSGPSRSGQVMASYRGLVEVARSTGAGGTRARILTFEPVRVE